MNKSEKIFYRFNTDQKQLKLDCVDLISKTYLELGQRPEKESVVLMAQLLYDDLINYYGGLTFDEVKFAFAKGTRNADDGPSCFVNVRTWNLWLKEYKKKAQLKRQQQQLTEFENYKEQQKQIAETINKAKRLK
jgi:aryl-alcohol dehydrogenase-like predicted oxidoreductase